MFSSNFAGERGKGRGRPGHHVYRYKKVAERGGRLRVDNWGSPQPGPDRNVDRGGVVGFFASAACLTLRQENPVRHT